MADDAGALLVRSGLVSSSALDDARTRASAAGGTLGEQLVETGAVADDKLTEFYRQRLLVPQVNPNTLARLPAKVVALIPSEMAVELRAIPVSLDGDNNLTVAMSDPSDRHAVDEIAFFTGAYIVRAVATQMQIAWCLAHYYGHVTPLGQRLLKADGGAAAASTARPKSITEQVAASRHRRLERGVAQADAKVHDDGATRGSRPVSDDHATPVDTPKPRRRSASSEPRADQRSSEPEPTRPSPRPPPPVTIDQPEPSGPMITIEVPEVWDPPDGVDSGPVIIRATPPSEDTTARALVAQVDRDPVVIEATPPSEDTTARALVAQPRVDSGPVITIEAAPPSEDSPAHPEAVAAVDSGPVITIEAATSEDVTARTRVTPRPVPKRRRPADPVPPELAERAGEVQLASGESIKKIDFDVPSIMISDELERALRPVVVGELPVREHKDIPPTDDLEDNSTIVIRDPILNEQSEPVLLDQVRAGPGHRAQVSAAPNTEIDDGPSDVVVLETKKPIKRVVQHTKVGIGIVAAATRPRKDSPDELDAQSTDVRPSMDHDRTRLHTFAAPPSEDYTSASDEIAAPPSPHATRDIDPMALRQPNPGLAPPPPSGQVRLDSVQRAPVRSDDDDDDDVRSKPTIVMSALELDEMMPERSSEVLPAHLDEDDGWGPPGSTIPPLFLGAIPGAITEHSGVIPIADVDTAPLMIAPPSAPEPGTRHHTASEAGVARALEDATSRVLDLIHTLDHTSDRDQVIAVMIAHLAESHQRAGFFVTRGGELSLFAIMPRVPAMPAATLRLDRPSTLQDVVGTRLPYRGPMHDDASRMFLQATLGACPAELLLVPIAVRERVVGVLFGDLRMRHTFDDQLALAARAAGMALERILKAKRG